MDYVIAGAGEVGTYLASLLSISEHNVVVIDKDKAKLDKLSQNFDISTIEGSATDLNILRQMTEMSPEIFLGVTDDDATNLVACAMAKSLGYPKTLARVCTPQFLRRDAIDFNGLFMVDHILCPDWSAAQALLSVVQSEGDYGCEAFADGAIQMRKIRLGSHWKKSQTPLRHLDIPACLKIAVIKRFDASGSNIIFPHGDDFLMVEDELTVLGQTEYIHEVDRYFGLQVVSKESILIVGDSLIAAYLCWLLESAPETYHVTWIGSNQSFLETWSKKLKQTHIIHTAQVTSDFLRSQQAQTFDMMVAASTDENSNITQCMQARELGIMTTAAVLTHPNMAEMATNLGIQTTICPNDHLASQIVKIASGAKITSMASVYSHRAEVMQLKIGMHSSLTGLPLHRLASQLPTDFLIGVVQHRGRTFLASGNTVLTPGDLVIAVSHPQHLDWIQKRI
jgi:trk system potassium uptake protein TrkA